MTLARVRFRGDGGPKAHTQSAQNRGWAAQLGYKLGWTGTEQRNAIDTPMRHQKRKRPERRPSLLRRRLLPITRANARVLAILVPPSFRLDKAGL
jgi:hypothetical protein